MAEINNKQLPSSFPSGSSTPAARSRDPSDADGDQQARGNRNFQVRLPPRAKYSTVVASAQPLANPAFGNDDLESFISQLDAGLGKTAKKGLATATDQAGFFVGQSKKSAYNTGSQAGNAKGRGLSTSINVSQTEIAADSAPRKSVIIKRKTYVHRHTGLQIPKEPKVQDQLQTREERLRIPKPNDSKNAEDAVKVNLLLERTMKIHANKKMMAGHKGGFGKFQSRGGVKALHAKQNLEQ